MSGLMGHGGVAERAWRWWSDRKHAAWEKKQRPKVYCDRCGVQLVSVVVSLAGGPPWSRHEWRHPTGKCGATK